MSHFLLPSLSPPPSQTVTISPTPSKRDIICGRHLFEIIIRRKHHVVTVREQVDHKRLSRLDYKRLSRLDYKRLPRLDHKRFPRLDHKRLPRLDYLNQWDYYLKLQKCLREQFITISNLNKLKMKQVESKGNK
ncbi:hypothetical protein AVEN_64420-1 [Araneus ventricosus]|uniref:Uncharacterized protein n=1 Tax=Araneus ventricosus TaxID=182803 RepID=A0A4Y2SK80_ARAVE|nr:hypothetical protein AVEN_64420-1 [Araneus ventricosus]